ETQAPLVDAGERRAVPGEVARRREHRAVSADHDRQIRAAPDVVEFSARAAVADALRGLALDDDFAAAALQEFAQRLERRGDLVRPLADQGNATECRLHRRIVAAVECNACWTSARKCC